ncbi:hypothetical protein [Polyangium spumosum]|uniref:Uncharacterized protein n=1 Tax=Polyangium spumosum TaxID=889282 RepID=A0A6N7PZS2_9BACT|nr:hypothetical protein [Polyangium spumosum]MRG95544.1 hypothetical protein [Polyangium spumosum]
MEYRSDLDAARMRIETLDAKLAEREASLRAREAEIAEQNVELARLRRAGGKPSISRAAWIGIFGLTHVLVAGAGALGFWALYDPLVYVSCPELPAAPAPTPPVHEKGPVAEGHVPPPPRVAPPASTSGAATDEDPEESETKRAEERMAPEVRACHHEETRKHPDAHGFVTVTYDIEPTGKVGRVTLSGLTRGADPWWSKGFETCVVAAYRKLTFRPSAGPKTTAKGSHFLSAKDVIKF